ncbi:MAG: S-(hydroxymethyl)glutathione dehydrogenase / alcohol dehydrogenase [Gaiellales bacterium]|nr:S-(hydroxymethyl)glutathione dehydrogenase / alcohol dehydrogenase [Gaiellales bacterium]MDX6550464.1 S-(hydroxymethyl)glutathione dehydrogenase / alcohol dehydrogenase [Gaiellales bacterium]
MSGEMRVRAAVLRAIGGPLTVEELVLSPPRADEVLVRVAAAGVCHSDVHLADGHLGHTRQPIVLGHEGAGVVEQVGAGVHHLRPGDHVVFCFVPACGRCGQCRAGRANLCETAAEHNSQGVLGDGTTRLAFPNGDPVKHFLSVACFAERCVVPAAAAIQVPAELPLWQAALIGCSVVTGIGAVRNAARVRVGESVAVIGCGGVGLQVVSGARLAGAGRIVAIDPSPEKLAMAVQRGATHAVPAGEDVVERVRGICGGGGADHAIEVVGRPETIRQAFDMVRPGGTAVVVGLAPSGLEVSLPALDLISDKTLRGCFYGSSNVAAEIPFMIEMVMDSRLDVAGAVSDFTDLEGIEEAFDRLRHGQGTRTVVLLDPDAAGRP